MKDKRDLNEDEELIVNVVRQVGICLLNTIAFVNTGSVRNFDNAEAAFEELGIRIVEAFEREVR
jgi:hypothetical protein